MPYTGFETHSDNLSFPYRFFLTRNLLSNLFIPRYSVDFEGTETPTNWSLSLLKHLLLGFLPYKFVVIKTFCIKIYFIFVDREQSISIGLCGSHCRWPTVTGIVVMKFPPDKTNLLTATRIPLPSANYMLGTWLQSEQVSGGVKCGTS
jgi:hypothetical protein